MTITQSRLEGLQTKLNTAIDAAAEAMDDDNRGAFEYWDEEAARLQREINSIVNREAVTA